jgi:autophagy-related protein 9
MRAQEYRNTPASIGSRQFTQLARWKFREFNELPHVFATRLRLAQEPASAYVDQFPKEKTVLVARFIAFVTGSFAAVLLLLSLLDPEAFLHFEVTKDRTVIFYLGVCTAILAISRGMIPDAQAIAADPEALMRKVTEHTHYLPEHWAGRLHSAEVHLAFGQLFQLRVTTFAHELLSVVVAPFVLAYTLPPLAPRLIDFFREFTVHVDGLGYVCSFAEFNFHRAGDVGAPPTTSGKAATLLGRAPAPAKRKLELSMLGFAQAHPNWQPEEDGAASVLFAKATNATKAQAYERAFQRAAATRPARGRATTAPSGKQASRGPPTTATLIEHDEAGLGASYVEPLSLDDSALPPSSVASPGVGGAAGREQSFLGLLTQAQRSW